MGDSVKKVALAMALVVAALSLGGCFVGKGKAPGTDRYEGLTARRQRKLMPTVQRMT